MTQREGSGIEACGVGEVLVKFQRWRLTMRKVSLLAMMLSVFLAAAHAQNKSAPAGKKEHVFKGKVEKVDLANKSLTVNGERVEGWMEAMTMSYVPDKEDALKKVKPGDQISAKVYDGDYRTLHDIQVLPQKPSDPKTAPPESEKKGDTKGKK
jgi:Cu/Ag efflux protein CusF